VIHSKFFIPAVIVGSLLQGCALFTSHYDATRHENFTKLKAVHMKLFDSWTEGSDKVWQEADVAAYCDRGDLSFREAFEYAKSKDDNDHTGQNAVKILWDEFGDNCKFTLMKKKKFSKTFSANLRPEVEKNYGYAIAGELTRLKAK